MTGAAQVRTRQPSSAPLCPSTPAQKRAIARSVASCQFAAFPGAIGPQWLTALQDEAAALFSGAARAEGTGRLRYRANITGLGDVALGFLTHPDLLTLLSRHFGGDYALTPEISCLTFYDESGHLGAHLDEPAARCAVTIILYLAADSPDPQAPETGLVLNVYGIERASVGDARLRIPTRAGTLVLGRGSRVWHERPPLGRGESVTAITGCYHMAGTGQNG
ncbi:hypothetical protein LCGC14_2138340 [marine sediment metagenome]|uniref:Fe2OG dioxygenase domain-containing protein n=1 Tax=marine sediment metagenome TaxID=412755 RepID=A0A0F9GVE6_9ZZZZ